MGAVYVFIQAPPFLALAKIELMVSSLTSQELGQLVVCHLAQLDSNLKTYIY